MSDEHLAVLTLADAGAYDYALAEYVRLGLDRVTDDEDVMALKGRLLKDIYRERTGQDATELARRSAEAYEAAFVSTRGFYSGINAATMSLLSGVDVDEVRVKAKRILTLLPSQDALDARSKYFIEATRAEANLLLGEMSEAARSMDAAREHDPLNYQAHASTMRQFQLIASHRGEGLDWLERLRSPRAMHFCGHLFTEDTAEDSLHDQIMDTLQTQDIGFGYGSLAAGSDIVIAETLLKEGGELHVVLPVSPERFAPVSVSPYGSNWMARFEDCLARASSLTIVEPDADWPSVQTDLRAAVAAMGPAIRRGWTLQSGAVQFLVWDGRARESGTALNAALWSRSGRDSHRIPFVSSKGNEGPDKARLKSSSLDANFTVLSDARDCENLLTFDDVASRIKSLRSQGSSSGHIAIGASFLNVPSPKEVEQALAQILDTAPFGGVYLDRTAADWINLFYSDQFVTSDISGLFETMQVYSLRRYGQPVPSKR